MCSSSTVAAVRAHRCWRPQHVYTEGLSLESLAIWECPVGAQFPQGRSQYLVDPDIGVPHPQHQLLRRLCVDYTVKAVFRILGWKFAEDGVKAPLLRGRLQPLAYPWMSASYIKEL